MATASTAIQCKERSLSRKGSSSSSFRLRSPSLNSLRLRRIFDVFDKNNDSMITVDELSQALNLLGLVADFSDLDSMINSFIQPGNDGLRFEDFEALHRFLNDAFFSYDDALEMVTEEGENGAASAGNSDDDFAEAAKASQEESDLSEAFKVFDEDGDGYISARELQVVLGKLGFAEGREIDRVEKMILSVDRNHDGRVDFFEFKDMMLSVVVHSS